MLEFTLEELGAIFSEARSLSRSVSGLWVGAYDCSWASEWPARHLRLTVWGVECMFTVSGPRFRVQGFGFRASGFGVSGVEFFRSRVSGFRFRVSGFGFRVSGLGFRIRSRGFERYLFPWTGEKSEDVVARSVPPSKVNSGETSEKCGTGGLS